jgi:hypothetical protein
MKKFFLIFSILLCQLVFGQIQNNDSLLSYSGIVSIDSATQKELALRARQWFNENFKNPKDVLELNDIENGELSGRGSFTYSAILKAYGTTQITAGYISVKISIWTKGNKYKYKIGPFSMETMQSSAGASNNTSFYITQSDTHPSIGLVKMNNKTKEGLNNWWIEIKNQCNAEAKSLVNSLQETMQKNYKGDW